MRCGAGGTRRKTAVVPRNGHEVAAETAGRTCLTGSTRTRGAVPGDPFCVWCDGGGRRRVRAFTCDDLFRFNNINLDPLTETYGIPFYLQYLAHWPEYFIVAEAPGGELMGYIMGKAEGSVAREEWHGHVTALSVAPEFRRLGLAAKLMELLEEISEKKGGFFVDLFVRVSNQVAVNMYKQLGYSVYRTVLEYYSASNGEPDEDAYDMRKALSRDTEKKSIIPLPHPVRPEDIE
ncbi:N-alpha-acetyltransferase 20 [Meleagris gallopavo]|uniref:N-alpha-acetyltransferase 20 n=1 Tax=Meleagris gallopavo TaxID=9103 RepID=UPI00093DC1B7|nr:N-alpha-acetyltransferase 20 [Meleagris gallopavo]